MPRWPTLSIMGKLDRQHCLQKEQVETSFVPEDNLVNSFKLSMELVELDWNHGSTSQVPSVLQVRLKGCKGVLALNTGLDRGIRIRPSMEKFKWNSDGCPAPYPLGITDNGAAMSRLYLLSILFSLKTWIGQNFFRERSVPTERDQDRYRGR